MTFVKNTRTGKTASVPDHYIGHPVLGKWLVAVDGNKAEAAPKKESKKKTAETESQSWFSKAEPETQEQPAPETNIENEEIEDGN
jgi:uncharacterized protein YccT (UPF0319 family)